MPKYYNPKTKTLVESSETLSDVALRFNVGDGKFEDVQLIGAEKSRGIERPRCLSARIGLGGLWTEPTYVSGLTGEVMTGHFDLTQRANRDLLLVEHQKTVKVGVEYTNTAVAPK